MSDEPVESPEHAAMRAKGVISLWLGNLGDEVELEEYLDESFSSDFGFDIYPPAGPECDSSEEAKPIRDLLDGFSSCASFMEEAVQGAEKAGWKTAQCAVIFYAFRYNPEKANLKGTGKLKFVGVYNFS